MMWRNRTFGRVSLTFSPFKTAGQARSASTMSNVKLKEAVDVGWENAKPYELIPGPKPFPVVGNVPRFLPGVGEYWKMSPADMFILLRKKYGEIVKLEGIPGRRDSVILFDPRHCEKMFRTEGPWPSRVAMETLKLHRERRDDIFRGNYGLFVTQGKNWHDFRSKVNKHMMQLRAIVPHVSPIDQVASDFIDRARDLRDTKSLEMPASFNNEINKWALESICVIALDHRMGCLEPNLSPDSEPQRLINNIHDLFDLTYKLEVLPSLWKLYETRNFKKICRVLDDLTRITSKYVNQAMEREANKSTEDVQERSLLEKLISIDEHTAIIMGMDMLTGGIDTTSNATAAAIYHIAASPEAQEKLREEAYNVLPTKNTPVTLEALNNIPYLKATIKETMRLLPISVGNMRTTTSKIVIGGYRIPEGLDVVMCHSIMSQDPQNFSDGTKFIPERWLKESEGTTLSAKNAHPFAYMPFGFGPRMCIGRRFAQLQMETLLIKMVRNFRMEWHHGTLEIQNKFMNTIGSPLKVKMVDI